MSEKISLKNMLIKLNFVKPYEGWEQHEHKNTLFPYLSYDKLRIDIILVHIADIEQEQITFNYTHICGCFDANRISMFVVQSI